VKSLLPSRISLSSFKSFQELFNLLRATDLKKRGKIICIALPIKVNQHGKTEQLSIEIADFIYSLGFKTVESHKVFVHRTLTREIMVYEKT
jgi:tRNA G10  N-methylase Trm11